MKIRTTAYLNILTIKKINQICCKMNISYNDLIRLILIKEGKNKHDYVEPERPVQYQKKQDKKYWTRLHMRLQYNDYNVIIGMRNFYKMTVSLLIAILIDSLYPEVMGNTEKNFINQINLDKYHVLSYSIERTQCNNLIYWKIQWGLS